MKHRIEIDGLRAFAILPVLLFHAGVSRVPGGFFGVDIFFVISGFLITGIIVNELHTKNSFSIVNFYERRARRIMPALYLVVAVSLPLAWFLLFTEQFKIFMKSLVSITFFGSNYFFLGQTGYFDPNIELNPMLHTWSLAIEEQFYVFFPLILWLLWKFVAERFWIPLLSVFAVASLVWANSNWALDSSGTFYLLQFRAWELLAGAIAAIHLSHQGKKSYSNQVASLLGLAMIIGSFLFIGSQYPHPGFITLVPIIGTVLIVLFAGEGTLANKILSFKPFVWIGLVSYSAYLWHQPLFAFFRVWQTAEPTSWQFVPIIALVFVLSYLSWRFVENPVRDKKRFSRKQVFIGTAALAVVLVAIAFVGTRGTVTEMRKSLSGVQFSEIEKRVDRNRGLDDSCRKFSATNEKCRTGSNPSALLWGDSYAMHLADALEQSPSTVPFVQQTLSACAPVLGLAHQREGYGIPDGEECIKHNDDVFAWLAKSPNIKTVILASTWADALAPKGSSLDRDGNITLNNEAPMAVLRDTVKQIQALGKQVVLVEPPPNNARDLGMCLAAATANKLSLSVCDFPVTKNGRATIDARLQKLADQVPVFSLTPLFCPDGTCFASVNGIFMYRDAGHITHEGSAYIGKTYDLMGQLLKAAANGK